MASTVSNPHPTEDQGPIVRGVAVTFLVLALIAFSLRAYVRTCMIKSFGSDDWLMTGGAIAFIFYAACVIAGVKHGTGRHYADLSAYDAERAMEFWFFCYLGYCWTMILSKLSIGIFLLRIINGQRIYVRIIYANMIVSTIAGLIFFFTTMLQCRPISYFWAKAPAGGSCISVEIIISLTYMYSAMTIICDFTFALLPIAIVKNLHMARRTKVATIPLLTMGCVASGGVVVRLAYVHTFRDPDFLYATSGIAIWSTVEAGLAITAGSLACTRPLFKLVLNRMGVTTTDGQYGNGPQDKSERRQYPQTIGSARAQQVDVYRLGSLDDYPIQGHADNDTDEILTTKDQVLSSSEALDWKDHQSGNAFTVDATEWKESHRPGYHV